MTFAGQGKHRQKVSFVQVDVQFAVYCGTARLYIGDIENLTIRSAGKPRANRLAHNGSGTVAPGDVGCAAGLFLALWGAKTRGHMPAFVSEPDELSSPLH